VKQYCYLGTTVNEKWNNAQEIKSHIGKARTPFNKISIIFKNHTLIIKTKMRYIRCYVFSELLNSVESWTTNDATKKIEAFELWLYKRILKIPWTGRITNIVLKRMNKSTELVKTFNFLYFN